MTQWAAFAGLTGLICTVFLLLARLSQTVITEEQVSATQSSSNRFSEGDDAIDAAGSAASAGRTAEQGSEGDGRASPVQEFSPLLLFLNVTLTQGLFGVILIVGIFYFNVPGTALGIPTDFSATLPESLAIGLGLGMLLWIGNEAGTSLADTLGIGYDETLREMLAPDSLRGWLVLYLLVLPIIAGVEELIFRAALIGAIATGFETSAWALAVVSSIAFALGHGVQGTAGIVLTGLLGFVLAAAFIVTQSLVVVIVAHYVVNALEIGIHEGLGIERPI